MTTAQSGWIRAADAARLLGVSRATLYAYVSRGFVRSQPAAGSVRERLYARDDLERLRRRTEERRAPDKAAARTLQWGMPVLESAISLIDGRRLYYRGHDAVALARTRSVEEVAALIWTGRLGAVIDDAGDDASEARRISGSCPQTARPCSRRKAMVTADASARGRAAGLRPSDERRTGVALDEDALPFIARAQRLLAAAAACDPLAMDLRPPAVSRTGLRVLRLLAAVAAGGDAADDAVDQQLVRAWHIADRGKDIVRAALVLCADHELNVSSFTARCVASAGSHPYAVVVAGLSALEGPKHGGAGARVQAMLDGVERSRPLRAAVAARIRRGEAIEGFGHPLYASGDPRAAFLLQLLRDRFATSRSCRFVLDVAHAAADVTGEHPNLDFALAAVARVLKLPDGAPLMLFAIGRSVGWIGHAMEQYATNQLIRPRAKYVGPPPRVPGD